MSSISNHQSPSTRHTSIAEGRAFERSISPPLGVRSHIAASHGHALERWLEGMKLQALILLNEQSDAAMAAGHHCPPPVVPKEPASAMPSNDWLRIPADVYIEGLQVVILCRVCPCTGVVRDYRIDLVRVNS
jgi:hypothetical protein